MLFYEYLKQVKTNSNNISHAIILETNNCCDYEFLINEFIKTLICDNLKPYCNSCNDCNWINKNNYCDLIYLNNDNEKISKQDILNIQKQFSSSSIEKYGKKIYVIKGIEECNKQTSNSLLKFIEQNHSDTYALFFTKNINKIIPTIVSRCNTIRIDDKAINLSLEIDGSYSDLINFAFDDYKYYKQFINEYNLYDIIENAKRFSSIKNEKDEIDFIYYAIKLKKDEFKILLKCLCYYVDINKKIFLIDIYKNLSLNLNMKNTCILISNHLRGN